VDPYDYLIRLSTIAVLFVGWSAIVVTLRRALEAELDALHMYFVRFFIEGGLAVAAFGLVPPALSTTDLTDSAVWRLASAAAAITFSVYFVLLFRRRRRITVGSLPLRTVVSFTASITATLALWANAVAPGFQPSGAVFALALTGLLLVGGMVFVENLTLFVK